MSRRKVIFNNSGPWPASSPSTDVHLIEKFHRSLPGYAPTPLRSLTYVAEELGLGAVYLKDESNRLGLPSFKILGASWGTFRAMVQRLNLPLDVDIEKLKRAASSIVLFAATDGNHGRAVAKMGKDLGAAAVEIYVPYHLSSETVGFIEAEGATVHRLKGSYDDAVMKAYEASGELTDGIFVQDTSIEGYEEIPNWIVEGYATMLREIDEQLAGQRPDLVITPIGVGSLGQSVVSHFHSSSNGPHILTVEPDTAACLWKNILHTGAPKAIKTTPTIMNGLDCGSVSTTAWPFLQAGVDASLTISDYETYIACRDLESVAGVRVGPCGASSLAALRRLTTEDKERLGLNPESVVVLLCTEGPRSYDIPHDVSVSDPVALTQTLVQINSANPALGSVPGPGEKHVANFISAWLEHRNIETHWIEPTEGRPSVVGVVRGTGGGKSLMLNGHIDTVTLMGYQDDPLSGEIKDGKIYGRGSADMKGGIAAALVTLANVAQGDRLAGDVIFTGVADEEATSVGTEQILAAGWRADAAIVNEPTNLEIVHAHKGFVWVEVKVRGVAAHGSRADLGLDAIAKAGYFLVEFDKYSQGLLDSKTQDPVLGTGSAHASIVTGGEEESSYPALCTILLERRTIPGETAKSIKEEIEKLATSSLKGLQHDIRVTFDRPPFHINPDHPFVSLVRGHVAKALEGDAVMRGERFWTDCALLADKGIPALLWGPKGEGLHAKEEWVEADSVALVAKTLTNIARDFCQ